MAANVSISGSRKECQCIGSNCMMWRWDDQAIHNAVAREHRNGHCGLAGKPEFLF